MFDFSQTPPPFTAIPSTRNASFFLQQKPEQQPPDDD
jgi:hypothetical protein